MMARVPLRDWIVVADSDELQDYGGATAPFFLRRAEGEGYTWVKGYLVDHVADRGVLAPVQAWPPLWRQFPLKCDVLRKLANSDPMKAAAFKAKDRAAQHELSCLPWLLPALAAGLGSRPAG